MARYKGDILIKRLDGTVYDLEAEGIKVISFNPPSSNYQHTFTQTGSYQPQLAATQIQQLSIPISFDVIAKDNYDYELQRLKVLNIFNSTEPFYVINNRIPWLRWKVVAEAYAYPRLNNYWQAQNVSFNLVAIDGFAESVAVSTDLKQLDRFWGIGMGLGIEDLDFVFEKDEFTVKNPSSIPLLSNERPVKITISGRKTGNVVINNKTTGQTFEYYGRLNTGDELIILGVTPYLNGQSLLGNDNSNRGFIDLAMGYNQFSISGVDNLKISFETRFYY